MLCPALGSPIQEIYWLAQEVQQRTIQDCQESEHLHHEQKLQAWS